MTLYYEEYSLQIHLNINVVFGSSFLYFLFSNYTNSSRVKILGLMEVVFLFSFEEIVFVIQLYKMHKTLHGQMEVVYLFYFGEIVCTIHLFKMHKTLPVKHVTWK